MNPLHDVLYKRVSNVFYNLASLCTGTENVSSTFKQFSTEAITCPRPRRALRRSSFRSCSGRHEGSNNDVGRRDETHRYIFNSNADANEPWIFAGRRPGALFNKGLNASQACCGLARWAARHEGGPKACQPTHCKILER